MNPQLGNTIAPILACGALITVLFGVTAVTHLRTSKRTFGLVLLGFIFAAFATVFENAGNLPVRAVLIFGSAAALGAVVARGVPVSARLGQVAWIAGLAAAGVAVSSWSAVAASEGFVRIAALASAVLGLAAAALSLFRLTDERDTPKTNATIAAALIMAGLCTLVAGVWSDRALLLVAGGVVALAGLALGRAMANAAGTSFATLLFGGAQQADAFGYKNVRQSDPEGAAMILAASQNVLIVPGYGLARAQGQHGVKELVERLEKSGAQVRVVVHPAAGIVPGHMNALLDEAGIPHSKIMASQDAASAIVGADVVVVGANDVVNSDAAAGEGALAGLDALNLSAAHSVWIIKRSLRTGQANVRNNLFESPKATLVLGDAKKVLQALVAELKNSH